MEHFNKLLKCAMEDNNDTSVVMYLVDNVTVNSIVEDPKAPDFITVTGGVIAAIFVVLNLDGHFKTDNLKIYVNLDEFIGTKTKSRVFALFALILVTPIVIIIMFLALLYKIACFYLIRKYDNRFLKFLDSFDVFWSLEDNFSSSIISVAGVIESDSPQELVHNIKHKLEILIRNKLTDKLFYRRHEKYGFYYWRKYNNVDINQYVKILDQTDKVQLTTNDLENLMTTVSRPQLSKVDQCLFQILITKQSLEGNSGGKKDYGIIFQIHHCVGDGVALIDFLCKTLTDDTLDSTKNLFSFPETVGYKYDTYTKYVGDTIRKTCEIPICFVDGILRDPDNNSLHGPQLVGKKVFKWMDSDKDLFQKVKDIKNNINGLKFSDILAVALSAGLHNYFAKTMEYVPEAVAVVVPVRFPTFKQNNSAMDFTNDFSVTILDLPTRKTENLFEIQATCNKRRQSADPITNYYFLKLVSSVLPKQILQPLLNSSQASMVFSNMPGPDCVTMCGGNLLKSIVFFVPHKGTTGFSVSSLYYGGVLRFAAMADAALVSGPDDLAPVLEGMVSEIDRLHRLYVTKV